MGLLILGTLDSAMKQCEVLVVFDQRTLFKSISKTPSLLLLRCIHCNLPRQSLLFLFDFAKAKNCFP